MPLVKMSDINKQQESTPSGLVPMGSVSATPKTEQPIEQSSPVHFSNLMDSPLMQHANQPEPNPQPDNGDMRTNYPGGLWNPLNDLGHLANSPIIRSFDNAAGKAMGVPDNMMNSAKPTGSKLLDTALNIAGSGAGYLTNPAQIEQNVGQTFFGNQPLQNLGGKVGGAIENNLPSNVATRALASTAEQATVGGLGSAAYAPFQTLIGGGDVQDIPRNVVGQGLQGALLGGALGGLGSLAKSGLKTMSEIRGGKQSGIPPVPSYDGIGFDSYFGGKPNYAQRQPSEYINAFNNFNKDPVNLDELVRSKGFNDVTPESIAQTYNNKSWYHGTGKENLTAGQLDPNVGNHESLFGQGIYLTDNPSIAEGYANSRGKRTGTPTIYETNVNTNRVLDLEKPITPDVAATIEKSFGPSLDYLGSSRGYDDGHFSNLIREEASKPGVTPENLIKKVQQEIKDFSHEEGISTNEFVDNFQDLATYLKESGYDGITHTGGLRTGNDPHRVLIMLDPQNWYGKTAGEGSQVTKFEKYNHTPSVNKIKAMKEIQSQPKEQALNIDSNNGEPIRLTPSEIARNDRIDKFSKVDNNPTIPNTADQIQSKTGRESIPLLTRANEAYIKGVDNLHRINQFDQVAKDANSGELKPSDSAYTLALNARGHDMQASQIVNRNLIDSKGEKVGLPLAAVTNQIPKGKESAFNDYTVAKHAIARMGRGEKVYTDNKEMTIQKAQAIVDNYDKTELSFKEIAKQYTDFSHNFAQNWYVDTGLMKQSQLDGYREANPDYVPNKRIFSDLEKKSQFNSKGGISGQTLPVKKAPGSQRQIVNPIESSIEDVAKGVKTAKMNEAGQAIVRSLQRNPEELKGFAEVVKDHPKLDVNKLVQEEGPQGLIDHINKTFEDATIKPDLEKGNVVTVLVNGEPVHVRIFDPQMLEAVSNLSPKGQDYVTAFVGKATKVMKTLTTGVNPIFGLTRNISRDIPHAFISSKTTSNPLRFGTDLVDGLTSVLADSMSHSKLTPDFMKGWLETRSNLYNDYKNTGGGHSSSIAADRNLLAQSKEKLIPSSGIGQTLKRNLLTRPYHLLENINNAAEAAPRLGEYKRVVKQGGGTYDSKVKGLFEANDLTVNFNKFGNVTKNVDAYLPYLNAAIQGMDQLARMSLTGGAKRLTQVYAKALGTLTIPTAILYMINHNDPNYQQTSNFIKDNNLLWPNGDGTFTKVAKPRELGMIFSTGVERALRSFADNDPKAFQDFSHNFLQNFLPPGVAGAAQGFQEKGLAGIPTGMLGDTIAGPIQSLASNKDFANRDIVPRDLAQLSPQNQYDAKTSEPAKLLGGLLNSSPKQLDYLAKSYGGVLGQIGIPATTKGGSLKDTLKQQVTVDPTFSNDISRNFYDQKAKADMANSDSKVTGDTPLDNSSKYYDRLSSKFSKIRRQQKSIQNDDSLSKTDKQQQIKELQQVLNILQSQATR
jgi:hypothetical protein